MTINQVPTVDQAIDRMRELQRQWPAGDGVGVFNGMYLRVTELVRTRLADAYFADPGCLAELDGVFAQRFLAAVDTAGAGGREQACWRPLFELRAHPGIHPLQFALAGMNAHIEHDLPLSVVDTCRLCGLTPDGLSPDYRRINGLLAEIEAQVRAELLPEPQAVRAAALLHVLSVWSIDAAREAAWAGVLALWELRDRPAAYDAYAAALCGSVGMVSRALLTPVDDGGRPSAAAEG